ncbi:hypothetical protein ISF_00688 [Cordyceps fumosorosea ARSEF 2679]|uniref:Uncharacterized protein n=1 Tax=Cordyceps fumosorosea (strain ARSEF 2679) TaxID=1081104 RepID=A0A168EGS2_CORFA|nr:hypothetical protein ISF_00688 [Cordyceps fumosorosea ARSEF 2679]OAA73787.1 hypothetical protein ISF_00688 [Cordyceps fumosorosea ARSEF 2679]
MEVETIETALKRVIRSAIPGTHVLSLQVTAAPGLHRIYRATTQAGAVLQCSLPPSPNRRLLRCECGSVRSEAATLQWLSQLCNNGQHPEGESSSPHKSAANTAADFEEDKKEARNYIRAGAVAEYLPRLLDHGVMVAGAAAVAPMHRLQYNIMAPRPGRVLSTLSTPLTPAERRSVDFQVGQMLRGLSLLRSPTSRFGHAEGMMPPVPQRSSSEQRGASVQASRETFARWSDAFASMLHEAIQDAQVNQITAAYDSIRRLLRRFAPVLDGVVEPRLVLVDAGLDKNVLVAMQKAEDGDPDDGDEKDSSVEDEEMEVDGSNNSGGSSSSSSNTAAALKVTGLREWVKPVFGDPLLSITLCREPSEALVRGLCTPLADTLDDDTDEAYQGLAQDEGDCPRRVQVRMHLYRIYHALNAISAEYVHRDEGSDPRELRARKVLVEAVRALETVEEEADESAASKRRRRYLQDASSKRQRTLSP